MKRAVIYIRVSTDEQADRGYSLGVQQEQLEKYCFNQGYEIVKLFKEDYSAKNFNRPEFKRFLMYAKSNHRNIDYFLFVSWDRFSRNAPDAYQMISKLKGWNITPQAITQPIDFSVPQSKIMLSIYLTLPEVDNDIRSEKVKRGMRGANKLGRWTTTAPIGYKNRRDEDNRPIIVPKQEERTAIVWAFEQAAKNERPLNDIRRELNDLGVKISKSSFSRMVRNPVYMGKILIPAFEDEPEKLVDGVHEGIVSETLFEAVQLALNGKVFKQHKKKVFKDKEELPLRGLLKCSCCGKHVTGSASKSRSGDLHYYYHCMHCGQERFRADVANLEMEKLLKEIQFTNGIQQLYDRIILTELQGNTKQQAQKKSTLSQELSKLEARKEQLQNTFLDGKLEPQDYTELKKRLDMNIFEVKAKMEESNDAKSGFKKKIESCLKIIPNLVEWYRNSSVQEKKDLIGSIFPDRFTFENKKVRTTSIDSYFKLVLKYSGKFDESKKGQTSYQTHLSHLVTPTGL